MDVEEDMDNEEEVVLNAFLGISDSKVLFFIEIMARTNKNQNYE